MKLCECGCGMETTVFRGKPRRFVSGHNGRLHENIKMLKKLAVSGSESPSWKGGKIISPNGYSLTYAPEHDENSSNYVPTHVLIAEKVIGKKLPKGTIVHHSDGNPMNNSNNNLVICDSQSYHNLLHKRMRAYAAGSVKMVRCSLCKQHDYPENMYIRKSTGQGFHRECHRKDMRERTHDNRKL